MRPEHFSRDIGARCLDLLTRFSDQVEVGAEGDARHGGQLTTTFLMALSTPIVVLPVERIFKVTEGQVLADDTKIDEALFARVKAVLGGRKRFGEAPFGSGTWQYAEIGRTFNLADAWPGDVFDALSEAKASDKAKAARTVDIVRLLRNALAHGGVAYLDKDGRQALPRVEQLAFASFKMDYTNCCKPKPVGVRLLRTTEQTFRQFVVSWARWIDDSKISEVLNTGVVQPTPPRHA